MSAAKKRDAADAPYIANYPALHEWLKKIEARCNWQLALKSGRRVAAYVESWSCPTNGKDFLVIVRANQLGWDVYTSLDALSIVESLVDASKRLGVDLHGAPQRAKRVGTIDGVDVFATEKGRAL